MNKIAKNFIAVFVGTMSSKVLSLLMVVYLARVLGPNDFGIINFSSAFIIYFSMLGSLGLQSLGIVEVAKNKKELRRYVNEITSLKIVLSLISFALLIVTILFIDKDLATKITIIITGVSVILNSFLLDWVFNALQEMKYSSQSQIISSSIALVIVVICISTGIFTKVYLAPVATNIAMLCANIYLFRIYRKKTNNKFSFVFSIDRYKDLLTRSWPFFFSGVFATINGNIDTIILGFMKGNYEVGLYNAAYKIVLILIQIVTFIFTPIFPVLIEYYKERKLDKLSVIINKTRKIILMLVMPLTVAAILLSEIIINTLYGSKYEGVGFAFTILLLYVCLLFIRELYGYQLTAFGYQKKYMNIVLISSSFNIVLNIILIPKFGIVGSAFTTLVSEIINIFFMVNSARKIVVFKYDNSYIIKMIFASMLMAVSIIVFRNFTLNAYILSGIAAVVYFAAIFILKVITLEEIKSLKKAE
ncbi:flippase [Clostridium sp. YIM B02505]|uniref:Flippase n=1 Tax=Clostridium yunnanense TaxID=2800325 RepID=A0ABS1EWX5_9CLOT|nr:flippase [Clostridium yunnanense]MBK1813891.1 flippase [Clostridium yunnanense]